VAGRRRVQALAWICGALLAGFLASLVFFPAPLVSRETPVARVIAMPVGEAERELEDQGFRPRIQDRETDPAIPVDHVLWQDPPPGVELEGGTLVRLTVSDGPASVVVPDLTEFSFDQASRVLRAGGFRVGAIDSVAAAQPAGVVLTTRPPMGSSQPSGSNVDLVVSRGPATIRVPNVVGMDRADAQATLAQAGLRLGTIQGRDNPSLRPGQVLEQRPVAGTLTPRNAVINLVIVSPEDT
jgi:beta-lactam-binding protein with PASTA domain